MGGMNGMDGMNGMGGMNGMSEPNYNLEATVRISLPDVYTGKTVSTTVMRNSPCPTCHDTGSDDGQIRVCQKCQGKKMVQQRVRSGHMVTIRTGPCDRCHGTGRNTTEHVCPQCRGGNYKEKYVCTVTLLPGHIENNVVVIKNQGHIKPNQLRGNILIKTEIEPDDRFLRHVMINNKIRLSDHDLLMRIKISLAESLCGFSKSIPHLSDDNLKFQFSTTIKDGDLYVMEGKGLPKTEQSNGHLYLLFNVEPVPTLSESKKKILWELLTETAYIEHKYTAQQGVHKCDT
jgi:DnaJ-class molecular chaperone